MSQGTQSVIQAEVIVIGGGLVGTAVAYGLARSGADTVVLDQGDDAFRASRGNFGLVWVQGKGHDLPDYSRWTQSSASRWPDFARALMADSGVDVQLHQPGGFHMCFNDEELIERQSRLQTLQDALSDYPFQMLDAADLKARLPLIGPSVVGASRWTAFYRVVLPRIRTGVIGGWMLAFIQSFDELTMTVFVATPGTTTLPVAMYNQISQTIDPLITAVSTVLIVGTLLLMLILDRMVGLDRVLIGEGK